MCSDSNISWKKIAYVVFVVFIVGCFFVSNYILSLFWGKCEKRDFADFSQKSVVYSGLESIKYSDISESLSLYGWAFAETDVNNSDKYIQVLLASEDVCYLLDTEIWTRAAIASHFISTYKILGNEHGFKVDVSTLTIPTGEYELYAYCCENETAQGMAHLGKKIIKDGRNVVIEDSDVGAPLYPPKR